MSEHRSSKERCGLAIIEPRKFRFVLPDDWEQMDADERDEYIYELVLEKPDLLTIRWELPL